MKKKENKENNTEVSNKTTLTGKWGHKKNHT